jgi:hypothetical protein
MYQKDKTVSSQTLATVKTTRSVETSLQRNQLLLIFYKKDA